LEGRFPSIAPKAGKEQSEALVNVVKAFMLRRLLAKDVIAGMLPPCTEMQFFSTTAHPVYQETTQVQIADPLLSTLTKLRELCSQLLLSAPKDGGNRRNHGNDVEDASQCDSQELSQDKVVLVSFYMSILSLIEEMVINP
jgi:hypothetical protein